MRQWNTIKGNQSNRPEYKKTKTGTQTVARVVSYWINNTLFRQMQVLLVHFVYYNMVLKMSYPLSHTVVNKQKKKRKKEQQK